MKLPLLLSVPHAGLTIPTEVSDLCILTADEIREDGDGGAREIYAIEEQVDAFVTTEIARVVVDLNRAPDDRRADGVVKTHTCWEVPVYREPLTEAVVATLLDRYYHPYHRRLADLAATSGVLLGVDGHTMAATAPPIGPDKGERPPVCLSNADGTCPDEWMRDLAGSFSLFFGDKVAVNRPFRGGFITRSRPGGLPWIQLELSRAEDASLDEKRERVLAALTTWVRGL